MNKLFNKIAALSVGLAMAIGVGVVAGSGKKAVAAKADTVEAFSFTRSGTADTVTSGYSMVLTNYNAKSGYYQDKSSSVGLDIGVKKSSGTIWTTAPTSISLTVKVGGGSEKDPLENNVTANLIDASGNEIANTSAVVTTKVETQTGKDYTVSLPVAANAAGVMVHHAKESGYNSRVYAISMSYESSAPVVTTYTVTYNGNGSTGGTVPTDANEYNSGDLVTVLGNTGSLVKTDCVFDGWNTKADGTGVDYAADDQLNITADVTLYAKWAFNGQEYKKITDLNVADKVIITAVKDSVSYYLPAATTSSAPLAAVATISDDKVQGLSSAELFTVSKDSSGKFSFKNADGKYLVNTSNNNGVRINTTTEAFWTVSATADGFKMTNNSRWLGVYNTADWRSYTTSDANNYKGADTKSSAEAICFYGIEKEVSPLESIELRDYPSSCEMDIGAKATLGYYGLDADGEQWTGDVTYVSSNTAVATISGNVLTAVASGTTEVTVYANAGVAGAKVESDPIEIEVLADPERIDLPVGNYQVVISAEGKKKGDAIPETSYEIKAKEGRTWYKNLSVACTDVSVAYANEYSLDASTGAIAFTNNSNAKITTVSFDWYTDNGFAASDLYVGSSTTPAEHTAGTGGSGSVYIYTINANENFRIANPSTEKKSSFYSVTINFEVVNESEKFHSLVVSKAEGWSTTVNGTYKNGAAPTNSGLVVTANFTEDEGQSISRSEVVTSQVSNWAYNPDTLHTGDTSFSVVATWSGHDSASFVVTNIVVEDIVGPIASGRYYIMNSTKTIGLDGAPEDSTPEGIDLSKPNELKAFDVTLVDDNEYEITVTVSGTKYYLVFNSAAASGSNSSIRVTSTPTSSLLSRTWSLEAVEGGYYVKQHTVGTTYRYLSQYSTPDWRGYVNTTNGDPVINFVSEGSLASEIVSKLNEAGLCGEQAPSTEKWSAMEAITHIDHELAILRAAEYTKTGSGAETVVTAKEGTEQVVAEAAARYDYIIGKYGQATYSDFLGRNPGPVSNERIRSESAIESNNMISIIIVIASVATVSFLLTCVIIKKRKEN